MQTEIRTTPITVSKSGVCVVDGYALRLAVERGRLVISDGIGPQRRKSHFARAVVGIRRLVVLGHTGFITLDALRWLADVGVGLIHLDPDGRVLASSANFGLDDPRLRRAQALAWNTPTGLAIARDLLSRKLSGQAQVARDLLGGAVAVATIEKLRPKLDLVESPDELMIVEAAAAAAYWEAWSDIGIRWVRVDESRVPDHWRLAGPRSSPLTGNPRLAATPAHALLNYGYGVLEAEARLACLAAGLDPGLGVLHTDQKSRDSLALDVMEAVRHEVDAHVLDLVLKSVFTADDFHETRQGVCRLLPPLTHNLAGMAVPWARALGPVVERVAQAFADGPSSRVDRLPTKLTQSNRSAGRDELRRQPRRVDPIRRRGLDRMICRGCGTAVAAGRSWCDVCRPDVKLRSGHQGLATARSVRAELRMLGQDPASSVTAKVKLSNTLRKRRAEQSEWDRDSPRGVDHGDFRRDVLPAIQGVPIRQLSARTGLSVGYCGLVKRGLRTPHVRWWKALRSAAVWDPRRRV